MKNPLTPAGIEPATFRFVAQHPNHCTTAMKNPLTPAGIEPATFRFVAQHPNHCATASEGFYVNEKSTDTSWDRTSDLPICSTAP